MMMVSDALALAAQALAAEAESLWDDAATLAALADTVPPGLELPQQIGGDQHAQNTSPPA